MTFYQQRSSKATFSLSAHQFAHLVRQQLGPLYVGPPGHKHPFLEKVSLEKLQVVKKCVCFQFLIAESVIICNLYLKKLATKLKALQFIAENIKVLSWKDQSYGLSSTSTTPANWPDFFLCRTSHKVSAFCDYIPLFGTHCMDFYLHNFKV